MSLGCALLRHDLRPRWIGDLLAAYCHTCGCLYVVPATPAPSVERPASLPPGPGSRQSGQTSLPVATRGG